jgi:hypothetical protein
VAISTIPALKAALVTILQARAALANTLVTYGWPAAPTPEMIILADVPEWTQAVGAMRAGGQPRDEEYLLEVACLVEHGGTDQQVISERAFALLSEIELELRTNATVGYIVRKAEVAGPGELREYVTPGNGRRSVVTSHIRCIARI